MAKFLVLSLLRTRFSGDIVVFRNTQTPLFMVARAGVREVFIETRKPRGADFWDYAMAWKFRARQSLDVTGYDKVLYLDADCLALSNLDGMLAGNWDLKYYAEPGSEAGERWFNCFISKSEAQTLRSEGVNGGLLAVRAVHFHEVMETWERIHDGPAPRKKFFADQAALTRLVIDTRRRKRKFTRKEVATPLSYDPRAQDYFSASLVHLAGCKDFDQKLRFMFGLYLNTFFCDPQATLLHILDL